MPRSRASYSNCYFGLAYLLLCGEFAEVVFVPGEFWPYLPHAGVVTRRRHYISFYRELPHAQNAWAPFWFWGSFRGTRRSRWVQALSRRGRIYRFRPRSVLWLCLAGYCLLFAPWCAAWAIFGPVWSLRWAARAWRRRKARRARRNVTQTRSNHGGPELHQRPWHGVF